MACSMMLFPFLHIPSIPSPNNVIVVAPTWALPVWTLGLCWTVRPGRILLGFPPLLCTCALVVPSPWNSRVNSRRRKLLPYPQLIFPIGIFLGCFLALSVFARSRTSPSGAGRGIYLWHSYMAIIARLYGPTIYSIHNINIKGGTYVTESEEAPDQSVAICWIQDIRSAGLPCPDPTRIDMFLQ